MLTYRKTPKKMKNHQYRMLVLLLQLFSLLHNSDEQNIFFLSSSPLIVNTASFSTYTVVDSVSTTVGIQCFVNTACTCASCNSGTPLSGNWSFVGIGANSSCYQNQINSLYQVWNFVRTTPTSAVSESFSISCCTCAQGSAASSSSATLTVVASIFGYVTQRVSVNASSGTYAEPTLYQAGYVDWGSCTCDLTPNYCDINCCCDPNCNTATITQEFSGCAASYVQTLDRSCTARPYTRSDYSKLMCVFYENNAIAGYIYSNITMVTSTTYSTLLSQGTNTPYQFMTPSPQVVETQNSPTAYVQNLAVKAVTSLMPGSSAPLLGVPQPTLAWSSCTSNVPVQVLKPFSSVCVQRATATTCADQYGPLSYLTYLQPPASALYSVSAMNTASALGISAVTYYCATTNQVAEFLVSNTLSSTTCWDYAVSMSGVSLPTAIGQGNTACAQQYSDRNQAGEIVWSSYTTCTAPLVVSYSTTSCTNAVLAVEYNFGWTAQNLTGINARILVGSVPINNAQYFRGVLLSSTSSPVDDVVINQRLKVNFTYLSTAPTTTTFTFPWNSSPYNVTLNSGSIGYQFAMPVIFSQLPSNSTGNITWTQLNSTVQSGGCTAIQQTYQSQIATLPSYQQNFFIIRSNGIGMCSDAQQQPIVFRQNMMGSCKMRVNMANFMASGSCQTLNNSIISYLNSFMPFSLTSVQSWVSVNGNPNLNLPQAASNGGTTISNQWMPIAWGTTYYRYIAPNASSTTIASAATYVFDAATRSFSFIRGICQGVVTGANLIIYYQSAGKQKSQQQYQIVGAALQYTFDNAAAFCVGPQSSQLCQPSSTTAVQDFMVTTSVQWVSVAASDSGPSYTICWYDVCFNQLFWIFNPIYYLGESASNVVLYGLTIVFGGAAVFLVTKPWY